MEQKAFKNVENLLLLEYLKEESENYFKNKETLKIEYSKTKLPKDKQGYNIKTNSLTYNDNEVIKERDLFHMALSDQELYQKEVIKNVYYDHGGAYWVKYNGELKHVGYALTEGLTDLLAKRCGQKPLYPFITYIADILDYLYDLSYFALSSSTFSFYLFDYQGKELINLLGMLDDYFDERNELTAYLTKEINNIDAALKKWQSDNFTENDLVYLAKLSNYALTCFKKQGDIVYQTIAMYYNMKNNSDIDKEILIEKLENIYTIDDYKYLQDGASLFEPKISNYIKELIDLTAQTDNKKKVLAYKRKKD